MSKGSSLLKSTVCPLDCPDTCSMEVEIREGKVTALDGSRNNPITAGFICGKVRNYTEHLYGEERLLQPAVRTGAKGEGSFQTVSWDEALARIAERLGAIASEHGGEAILPLCYGGSNGHLSQDGVDARFFRRLGASRLARTVCAAATGAASAGLYGKMPGVAFEDYVHARLIVIWGCNPASSGIHLIPYIRKAQRRGAKLVVVDPRRTLLASGADLHLPIRPGTDLPVALALISWLFENGVADEKFLAANATGVEELKQRAAQWSLGKAASLAQVPEANLATLALWYARTHPAVIRCGWGLERNRNGGSAVAAVLALPAVAGKFGIRGGGYTLSNAAALRLDAAVSANEPEAQTRIVNMNKVGRALHELDSPPIQGLFVYNCNPLATLPNQSAVLSGLQREDLFTVVFEQVRTDTARYADVLLPATTFLEHAEVKAGYGIMGVQKSAPLIPPVGEARPNYQVFADLCRRMDLSRPDDPEGPDALLQAMLGAHPDGARLNGALVKEGIAFPEFGPKPIQFQHVKPATKDAKVHLFPEELDREAPAGLYAYQDDPATAAFPLALVSPSTTKTISSTLGQLVRTPAAVTLHPDDAQARGIADGDAVRLFNEQGEVRCLARVNPEVRPGVASLPKGLWRRHTRNGFTANVLAPDSLTDLAGGACFNDARVEVERAEA